MSQVMSCVDCIGPPPDTILTMPPPPMPIFLMPNYNQTATPCNLLCDWTTGQGGELVELPHQGNDDSWVLLTTTSLITGLLLVVLLAMLLKCRPSRALRSIKRTTKFNDRTYESILYPVDDETNGFLWATLNSKGKPQHVSVQPPPLPPRVKKVPSFENNAYAEPDDSYTPRLSRPLVSPKVHIETLESAPINYFSGIRKEYPSLL